MVEQLHHALNSRTVIEQAKGVIAERAGLDMEGAFSWLRNHARDHNLLLVDVAQSVMDETVAPDPPEAFSPPLNVDPVGPGTGFSNGRRRYR